jgi:hypothetical protein
VWRRSPGGLGHFHHWLVGFSFRRLNPTTIEIPVPLQGRDFDDKLLQAIRDESNPRRACYRKGVCRISVKIFDLEVER